MMLISTRPTSGSFLPRSLAKRAIVGIAALRIELVAKRRIGLQHDPLPAPPVLEAEGPGSHRIRHHPAGAVRVGFDHFARDPRGGDGREVGQELVVGEVELELQRVAVDRLQALDRRVVVELARLPGFRDDGLGADEAPVERLQRIRAHPRVEHALHPVHVVGGRQLPALPLEHRVVGEVDAGPDADRPGLAVGGNLGHAHRRVRHELVGACEIVVLVERVEDRAVDAVRVLVAGGLRIEARLRRGKRDAQHPVRVAPARGTARRRTPSPRHASVATTAELAFIVMPRSSYSSFSMSALMLSGSALGA